MFGVIFPGGIKARRIKVATGNTLHFVEPCITFEVFMLNYKRALLVISRE